MNRTLVIAALTVGACASGHIVSIRAIGGWAASSKSSEGLLVELAAPTERVIAVREQLTGALQCGIQVNLIVR